MHALPTPNPSRPRPPARLRERIAALALGALMTLAPAAGAHAPEGLDEHGAPGLRADGGERLRGRMTLWAGASRLMLDDDAEVRILRRDDQGMDLRVERGSVALRVARDRDAMHWRVETVAGVHLPHGAGQFRVDAPRAWRDLAGASATAWRSALRIEGAAGTLLLMPGRRAELDRDGRWQIGLPMGDTFSRLAMADDEPPPVVIVEREPPPPLPPVVVWETARPYHPPRHHHHHHEPAPPPPRPWVVVPPPRVVVPIVPMPAREPRWEPPPPRMQPPPAPPRPDRRHHDGGGAGGDEDLRRPRRAL